MSNKPNRVTHMDETTIAEPKADTVPNELALTLESPGAVGGEQDSSGARSTKRQRMKLLTGSRGNLSDEIDHEMLSRLRIASLLLFFGNLAFLVRGLLWPPPADSIPLQGAVFWAHATLTMVTGLVGVRASMDWAMQRADKKCDSTVGSCRFMSTARLTGWHLRISELLVFGGSAIFFLLVSIAVMLGDADYGFFAVMNGPWILLIFTYALFMPNDWRRAACVIVPMALCPLLAMAIAWYSSEAFRTTLRDPHFSDGFSTTFLSMAFAASVAIYGVRTIRSLRKEAFQAKQLGQYRLTKLLGRGGMGEVYAGEHLLLKRACAIKVIRPEKAGDEQVLKRFEREVQSTAKLRHWNTVDIYDYGRTDDGTFYYVMEFLPGLNLQQLVDQYGPMPEARVIHLLAQTCDALTEAHAAGMVHRDIKPANIFITEFGRLHDVVKLLDFGLVRPLSAGNADAQLTQQNVILGSPTFMPPEQASGEPADVRSDIYSLGVVAFFLLSGSAPFDGDNPLEVIMAHARKTPPALDTSKVSPAMIEIVMRCLEKESNDRFQTSDELKQAMTGCEQKDAWSWESSAEWWKVHSPMSLPVEAEATATA